MNTDNDEKLNEVTELIIGCAFAVSNTLGAGFLEKVYENALSHELRKHGLNVEQQYPIAVRYDGTVVGEFRADILVEHVVMVEIKATATMDTFAPAQCLNYLAATKLPICLMLNFGKPRLQIKRYKHS